jgi:plasmid stabilization system protein ParE
VTQKLAIKLSANFENNLESIEHYLAESGNPQIFDTLLADLTETVIPNLERFPAMGRLFTARSGQSVETSNGLTALSKKMGRGELREYLLGNYLILYVPYDANLYLLSIKHHRQLSFDFQSIWVD